MMDHFNHTTFTYPYTMQQTRGFRRYYPVTTSLLGQLTTGGGCGFGQQTMQVAYGEYLERSYFTLDVQADCQGRLAEHNTIETTNAFAHMLDQVSTIDVPSAEHRFKLSRVNHILSGAVAYVPTVLVTLSYFDTQDRQYVSFSDSCGEAAHTDKDLALQSSLREFIERQSLVSAWLTQRYRHKVDSAVLTRVKHYERLAADFLANGELHIYDLNLCLPGYAVVIFYFAKSSTDFVQYAIGMAGGLTPAEALGKALNELWLDYNYLYYASDLWGDLKVIPSALRYTVRHAEDNHSGTRDIIPFHLEREADLSADDFLQQPAIAVQQALEQINAISPHVFLYHRVDDRGEYHYTKLLSPDFFLHMAVKEPLNRHNRLMDTLGVTDQQSLYRETIPFP